MAPCFVAISIASSSARDLISRIMPSFTSTQIIQQSWANWLQLVTPPSCTHAKSTMKCSLGWALSFLTMWKSARVRSSAQTLLSPSGRKFPLARSYSDRRRKSVDNLLWRNKRTLPGGLGATSKQQSNIANFTEQRPQKTNNHSMKTILGSASVMLLTLGFSLTRSPAEETQSVDMRFYPPTTIEWKAGPAALPTSAKMAVLEGDPTKEGPFVVRFQFPEGYHIPPHTHPKTERVTVISGVLYLATGEALDRSSAKKLPAGSFGYWPAGMKHTAWSEGETVIQLHGVGPWQINYVNPADDPRNAKKSP